VKSKGKSGVIGFKGNPTTCWQRQALPCTMAGTYRRVAEFSPRIERQVHRHAKQEDTQMHLSFGQFIVWLVVGALAGNLAGRLVTFKKEGLGRWTNLGVGMVGALIGGLIFNVFHIDLGLGELKVTFEDLIAAFLGSLLLIVVWWLVRMLRGKKKPQ
jgi:uncharacterized membrane protein YeaQ/YmgE (transglycosylase-associated protein family)